MATLEEGRGPEPNSITVSLTAGEVELYDERFCRMWEFYLAGCEASFRHGGLMVFQLQMAAKLDTVPLTRDYITDWERAQEGEAKAAEPRRLRKAGS